MGGVITGAGGFCFSTLAGILIHVSPLQLLSPEQRCKVHANQVPGNVFKDCPEARKFAPAELITEKTIESKSCGIYASIKRLYAGERNACRTFTSLFPQIDLPRGPQMRKRLKFVSQTIEHKT